MPRSAFPDLLPKARLQHAHVSSQLDCTKRSGACGRSRTYSLRIVGGGLSLATGFALALATGSALAVAALDEATGSALAEPALFFVDESLSASGAFICGTALVARTFIGPKML